jgi:hypothetical protein
VPQHDVCGKNEGLIIVPLACPFLEEPVSHNLGQALLPKKPKHLHSAGVEQAWSTTLKKVVLWMAREKYRIRVHCRDPAAPQG